MFVSQVTIHYSQITILALVLVVAGEELLDPLAVEAGDVLALDLLGAFGLAGVGVGAGAEAQLVHLADHLLHAVGSLHASLWQECQMADLGADKEHGRGVLMVQ